MCIEKCEQNIFSDRCGVHVVTMSMACAFLDMNWDVSFAKKHRAVFFKANVPACRIHMVPSMP